MPTTIVAKIGSRCSCAHAERCPTRGNRVLRDNCKPGLSSWTGCSVAIGSPSNERPARLTISFARASRLRSSRRFLGAERAQLREQLRFAHGLFQNDGSFKRRQRRNLERSGEHDDRHALLLEPGDQAVRVLAAAQVKIDT